MNKDWLNNMVLLIAMLALMAGIICPDSVAKIILLFIGGVAFGWVFSQIGKDSL